MTPARAGSLQESNRAKGKVTEEGWSEGHWDVQGRDSVEWFYVNPVMTTEERKKKGYGYKQVRKGSCSGGPAEEEGESGHSGWTCNPGHSLNSEG